MKAETMMKRINTVRKDIVRYGKEIQYYQKEYVGSEKEHMKAEGKRWVDYYSGMIKKAEDKIAEMSKQAAALATEDERKQMIRDMAKHMEEAGIKLNGLTTSGLRYCIYHNQGLEERSTHCWQMAIEGQGTVFTSGTLETVAEYILTR